MVDPKPSNEPKVDVKPSRLRIRAVEKKIDGCGTHD
ncbi:hypothetical protein A2U01_0067106 [Trifolium medium]|uniref:Uncharacterized protein n=1 Tax=Trifolium medium TaxID=97028 RepID=A0A392SBS5_9FABA|nr:hypothetical protein [Trifolium medium]